MEISTLTRGEEGYPRSLRESFSPERLYALGNLDLIYQPCIGLCGSRNATVQALAWARRFGAEAAKQGIVVVSGYARGVDTEAHKGALDAGGSTIAVLPEGIRHFRVRRELKDALNFNTNFLALSMYDPDDRWTVWRAMQRNKLIVGLSSGLFVIEASESGGTINAAYECVRQGKKLWAVSYKDDLPSRGGNRKLLATSALPVAKVEDFRSALEQAMEEPPPDVRQLVLMAVREDNTEPGES